MAHRRVRWLPALLALGWLAACGSSGAPTVIAAGSDAEGPAGPITDPYVAGPYTVENRALAEGESGAPKRMRLFIPQASGRYPVIQFNAGFQESVDDFESVLTQLASYGFVVVAPQLVPSLGEGGNPSTAPSIDEEVRLAGVAADWIQASLPGLLTVGLRLDRYGLAGHSRGGQVVWRLLLARPGLAQAIAGIDPVDGNAPPFSNDTGPLVTAQPFHQGIPSYTLGAGLGGQGGPLACAPAVRNYALFYAASDSPAWQVVATDYGHADMLDADSASVLACVSNPLRSDMIRFTGGQLVAFFAMTLKGAASGSPLQDLGTAPIAASGQHKSLGYEAD